MNISQDSVDNIEKTIQKALQRFVKSNAAQPEEVTDIHIQPIQESGILSVLNDDDEVLASTTISDWENIEEANFNEEIEKLLSGIITKFIESGYLDQLAILKPYSFVLIDDEKETITDLAFIDDDTLILDEDLLRGLDKELDSFLKDLLDE